MMRASSAMPPVVLLTLAGVALPGARAQYPDPAKRITLVVAVLGRRLERYSLACDWPESSARPWQISGDRRQSGRLPAARWVQRASPGVRPDGYTLLILSSTYAINSAVMANLPFDPKTSFAAVAMLGKAPMMLAAIEDIARAQTPKN